MTDKQVGILDIDVFSSERKYHSGGTSHLDFLSYLKSTCYQKNKLLCHKKMIHKPIAPLTHQTHQHLILTMRTQYEARPNS